VYSVREREFIFHIAKTLNKYTTEMQNQEGCQKGTWPIKAGHPLSKLATHNQSWPPIIKAGHPFQHAEKTDGNARQLQNHVSVQFKNS